MRLNMQTTCIRLPENADTAQAIAACRDLLTGLYDVSRYPHAILVDRGNETHALSRLQRIGIVGTVEEEKS